jgi:hypothetical protein
MELGPDSMKLVAGSVRPGAGSLRLGTLPEKS